MSAPRSSRCVAKLCRSVWGVVRRSSPLVLRCFSSMRPTLRVVSRRPNLLTKHRGRGTALLARRKLAHRAANRSRRAMAYEPTGAIRSRRPLPRTRSVPPAQVQVAVVQPGQLAHAQPGRVERFEDGPIAQPHRHRPPAAPPASGRFPRSRGSAAASAALRGLRSGLAGLALVQPSRWPKRKKLRIEARRRAMVRLGVAGLVQGRDIAAQLDRADVAPAPARCPAALADTRPALRDPRDSS